jgi:hypothetical protein
MCYYTIHQVRQYSGGWIFPDQIFLSIACLVNIGIVNLNLLPLPCLLSTQIVPPFFSTNSLQSNNPKPVPFSSPVPVVV